MTRFIEDHRAVFGVGPICKVLPIAPATYYARAAVMRDPELASERAKSDVIDCEDIGRIYKASGRRYGARKVWHVLRREGNDIARCTVERLMKAMEIQGVVRGGKVITTNPDAAQPCPDDKVNREFVAQMPNRLWVSDFTYVSSWQGMVYVAFVIDVFCPQDRGLAGFHLDDDKLCAGCFEPGNLPALPVRSGQPDPSFGSGFAISGHKIHRTIS